MQENLKQFVRQQALRGETPEKLREGLILNGWDAKDVDSAIKETYNIKKKISKSIIILSIILVLAFTTSLILLFNTLYFDDDTTDEIPRNTNTQNETHTNNLTQDNNCISIDELSNKEDCYLEKIKQGYDCTDLSEIEEFYCTRTLESYLLNIVES